jgi:phospholipid/cholesterol/gamma-HCH transport system permease protein
MGRGGLRAVERLGRAHLLLVGILGGFLSLLPSPQLVIAQVHNIGVRSVLIVAVSGLFVGMVLGLQGHHVLSGFGTEDSLGMMVAASLVRELGPVVLAPRFFGGVIAMPLLAAIFSAVGVMGGWLVGVGLLGLDDGAYWSQMQAGIDARQDVHNGVVKSLAFGVLVTWIALFQGYDAVPTSEGVSRATTRSVVHSALAVLGLDFVLTALMFGD